MSAYNPPNKKTTIYNSVSYRNAITALADTTFDEVSASIGKFTQLFLGDDNVATILNGKQDNLANQVGFRAFSESSSFTTLGGKLPYNITEFNFESANYGINHEFTAPLSGRYFPVDILPADTFEKLQVTAFKVSLIFISWHSINPFALISPTLQLVAFKKAVLTLVAPSTTIALKLSQEKLSMSPVVAEIEMVSIVLHSNVSVTTTSSIIAKSAEKFKQDILPVTHTFVPVMSHILIDEVFIVEAFKVGVLNRKVAFPSLHVNTFASNSFVSMVVASISST